MQRTHRQVVISWAAAATGLAAILLPFTLRTSPADVMSQWLRAGADDLWRIGELWPIALPFFLALPIALASFSGGRAGWTAVAAWIAAALGAALPPSFLIRELVREAPAQANEWLALAVFPTALALGATLLRRGRSVGNSHTSQSVKAMQLAYLANAVFCLIEFAPEWQEGAWCVLATSLLYAFQLPSRQPAVPQGLFTEQMT